MQIVDVQGQSDSRNQAINKVGIKDVAFRSKVTYNEKVITFQGTMNCYVHLDAEKKGTHMSRMARGLFRLIDSELSYVNLSEISKDLFEKLETKELYIEITGQLIREKKSPINDFTGYESLELGLNVVRTLSNFEVKAIIKVIGTSLCPASKINSKYGAHNQRSLITLELPFDSNTNLSQIVALIESNFSTRVYPILKLDDESFVTEDAYNNPKFVEDIVRDVSTTLRKENVKFSRIECENFESIHTHNAYALILND